MCSGMSADLQDCPRLLIPILEPCLPRAQAYEAKGAYSNEVPRSCKEQETAEQIGVQEQNVVAGLRMPSRLLFNSQNGT
jgi:hypothetical protein